VIKSGSKGLYLEHKVAAKEGLFPLGRMYNVHPRHIANFNGIDFNKGLAIGQQINIPLTDTNFKQSVHAGVPVYYRTMEKETMANISVKSKAPIKSIRSWNKVYDDNINAGEKLIVGFLITNEMKDRVVSIVPDQTAPVVEESVSNVRKAEDLKKQTEEAKKEPETKREEPKTVLVEESVSNVKKAEELKKQVEPEIKKEEPKKIEPVVVKQPEVRNEDGAGYFKNNFYSQVKTNPITKNQTVTSSIFKTQSGWQDAKYYLLINGVEPGTIVKITNPSNSKTVYAKVLYSMEKIRENQGVDIRISDAAASSLAVSETDKFILKVNY
jgi:LysM repeat protein